VVSIRVVFNPHFPDNQTMVAGAMVPWQMFKEILLFIAAAGDARASMRGTGIAWENAPTSSSP
jgi:hypothetical protein